MTALTIREVSGDCQRDIELQHSQRQACSWADRQSDLWAASQVDVDLFELCRELVSRRSTTGFVIKLLPQVTPAKASSECRLQLSIWIRILTHDMLKTLALCSARAWLPVYNFKPHKSMSTLHSTPQYWPIDLTCIIRTTHAPRHTLTAVHSYYCSPLLSCLLFFPAAQSLYTHRAFRDRLPICLFSQKMQIHGRLRAHDPLRVARQWSCIVGRAQPSQYLV